MAFPAQPFLAMQFRHAAPTGGRALAPSPAPHRDTVASLSQRLGAIMADDGFPTWSLAWANAQGSYVVLGNPTPAFARAYFERKLWRRDPVISAFQAHAALKLDEIARSAKKIEHEAMEAREEAGAILSRSFAAYIPAGPKQVYLSSACKGSAADFERFMRARLATVTALGLRLALAADSD